MPRGGRYADPAPASSYARRAIPSGRGPARACTVWLLLQPCAIWQCGRAIGRCVLERQRARPRPRTCGWRQLMGGCAYHHSPRPPNSAPSRSVASTLAPRCSSSATHSAACACAPPPPPPPPSDVWHTGRPTPARAAQRGPPQRPCHSPGPGPLTAHRLTIAYLDAPWLVPNGCITEAPWLLNGGHGASLRRSFGSPARPPPPPPRPPRDAAASSRAGPRSPAAPPHSLRRPALLGPAPRAAHRRRPRPPPPPRSARPPAPPRPPPPPSPGAPRTMRRAPPRHRPCSAR
jgi:hypothetical protein